MKTYLKHGTFAKAAGGKPDDTQLELINQITLEPITADQVYVRTVYLAHNAIDRDGDVFDDALLDDFANTLPGKGLFVKHPLGWDGDTGPGVGRFFSSRTFTTSQDEARQLLREPKLRFPPANEQAKILEGSFFISRTEKHTGLISDIDLGIASDVSVGFRASDRSAITNGATDERIATRLLGPGEALEGSLVWLGAQPGARVHKQASLFDDELGEHEVDELKKLLESIQKSLNDLAGNKAEGTDNTKVLAELESLKTKCEEMGVKVVVLDDLRKALGDDADELLKTPEVIVSMINDARAARTKLIDDVIAAERVAGLLEKDDDEGIAAAKKDYQDFSTERLQKMLATAQKRSPGKGPEHGGDPNATGADNRKTDGEKDMKSYGDNPLLGGQAAA